MSPAPGVQILDWCPKEESSLNSTSGNNRARPGTETNVLRDKSILKDSARLEELCDLSEGSGVLDGHCFPQYGYSGGCLGQCRKLENDLITEREYNEGKGHRLGIDSRSPWSISHVALFGAKKSHYMHVYVSVCAHAYVYKAWEEMP